MHHEEPGVSSLRCFAESDNVFSHSGGFDGSASYLVHRHDGIAWAVVVNTRQSEPPLERDLHQLSWQIAGQLQA